MPLLFAVVARGNTVLAKYAGCAGNFTEVTDQILSKISPENAKLTYSHGSYLFHYVSEDRIIYLCITDDDFDRSRAFLFLNDIKRKFQTQYGTRSQTALPYAMNSEFSRVLAALMKHYSENRQAGASASGYQDEEANVDKVAKVQGQVDELKGIMVKNIDSMVSRGERLELLVDKTEDLSSHSVQFRKSSQNLARSLWWKNVKITIVVAVIAIIVLYLIVSWACGGLDWPCTRKQ
ncbi:vesicle-associated membrane protein 7-like [Lingula anatina]|uniref:Vesicle-associated membrane protein 7 n=1 Tax=Lingula anatina TaxID=7574 RepID=A0A1S3KBD9_LINAN|nr:vesicle-associated membrane protein 7-like [Lingula anatina]XP_013419949.1 vesicle-associated membrane protein 7-like [Lingula anatina]XP_013419950.1 vesicle-associated membrane protein 7-like [Lingula anatina]|eukprot:XP_013419948.1 vesicle-associated membrane protein 7-like [Lingula anatina]